ncbi:MAG TPA: sigma-54-dependent Fis family transcriptional regulator [Calditrichia bacterium]|nr:sigma-54-dependent Fis family transcriptional regulator [Calditrichota bacterium]HQU71338.1 sigma-54-dependent Fis family transcriptional regulator [Calditrichia bacterium]HQV31965.1 sigma-54-dependent Fis family transcriptional regulator [Calditrichia bacterium]
MRSPQQQNDYLFELLDMLSQQSDFDEILRVISTSVGTLFQARMSSIVMINPGTQHTVKTVIREGNPDKVREEKLLQSNIIGWCMKNQADFLSPKLCEDSRFSPMIAQKLPPHSAMATAIRNRGALLGYLVLSSPESNDAFQEADLNLLRRLAVLTAPYLDDTQQVQHYFNKAIPDQALITAYQELGILGKSQPYVQLLKSIEAAARCEVRVLLFGKSGTGKEKIARAVHHFSARNKHPFLAIDCGAIPENLIESELFGHVKGAFTGASFSRKGLFQEADRGTLFLDEVANLPFDMQAKLLRVLQEGEIRPVGSNKSQPVNVRIIAAASRDLRDLVEKGEFREDLFYRLHVYPIEVPTLNQRMEDIPLLANHFLKEFAREQNKTAESFAPLMMEFMQLRAWPGNIRQLENFVERILTLAPADMVVLDHHLLPHEFQEEFKKITFSGDAHPIRKPLNEILEETERDLIRQALQANNWNQSQAARALRISERAIRYKIEKLGIQKQD